MFSADCSSQKRPANTMTFEEFLAQPSDGPTWEHPGLWAVHSQSACDPAEYTSPRKTFDVLSFYKTEARG